MSAHHVNGITECPACEEKLKHAHAELAKIFETIIKPAFADCHISWSYRNKTDQNEALAEGKSKLAFPLSAHNKSDDQGNPCAMALDLFQLCSNGMACWSYKYFRDIDALLTKDNHPVIWGGNWKTIGDSDHFQLK